jgi:hypothetical protein
MKRVIFMRSYRKNIGFQMDISSAVTSSSRLLDAFERMGLSQGEGLISSGPSPVPQEAAKMFEQLMEHPQSIEGEFHPSARSVQHIQDMPHIQDTERDTPLQLEATDTSQQSMTAQTPETYLPTPVECYQWQFQVAMLRLQTDTGSQVQQQAAQGMDSLLRNQS